MIKSFLAKCFARHIHQRNQKWIKNPLKAQEIIFKNLIKSAAHTEFGKDHKFESIRSRKDFTKHVPVRDYEALSPYIERVKSGEKDVLWRGKPMYFAKTSGTTSGAKYIPITAASMPYHIRAARDAILAYIHETGNAKVVNGKMIFLQGSPEMTYKNGIGIGRLSGIVAHYVPRYLQRNRLPSWNTNCIADWEAKVEAIVRETMSENMTIISGIPPWVQMYFEQLIARTGKSSVKEIFPEFDLFIYGGVQYAPYKTKMEALIGRPIDSIELYPASEGFFAYQDAQDDDGLLLLVNGGIFYEFVRIKDGALENSPRLTLAEVEVGEPYALIISTNAGLWAYNMGDTITFTSISPYKIKVTGRIKHFISAFGEHVIASEVESAIRQASEETGAGITEFTVAPMVQAVSELPYHQWFIEFDTIPSDLSRFAAILDAKMQQQNIYYRDLVQGKILQPLKITLVKPGGFSQYMKALGKLGAQNKVQRLSNDRELVGHPDFQAQILTGV